MAEKLSKNERLLYNFCASADDRTVSQDDFRSSIPDMGMDDLTNVANNLIARGMLQMKKLNGELLFVAVDQNQQKASASMAPDERLIYDCIASTGNTGIWTKTLKARTNIHQSNINKYIKSLEGKTLIKSVKSVKYPTRKIYMLSHLQPSIELSGGPWYTDNELDVEFIGILLRGIRKCLSDRSSPTLSVRMHTIYPSCHTPFLATTVDDVAQYLRSSQIIQEGTELTNEHIATLLEVLIYDGQVERLTVGHSKRSQARVLEPPPKRQKIETAAVGISSELLNDDNTGPSYSLDQAVHPAMATSFSSPNTEMFVYRWVQKHSTSCVALLDVPCGHCPQFSFCAESGRAWQDRLRDEVPLPRAGLAGIGGGFEAKGGLSTMGNVAPVDPTKCIHFRDWLDF